MRILRIISITVLFVFCIILIGELNFLVNLPYENEQYFDENTGVVYHRQEIIIPLLFLIICVLTILFIIFIIIITKKNKWRFK
jgi:hypothetical protein